MDISSRVAQGLLSIGAVFLRPQEPFTWASGIKSPIYCDNRLILTAPAVAVPIKTSACGNSRCTVSAMARSTVSRTAGAVRMRRLSQ